MSARAQPAVDHYVLALSWSPTYCASQRGRDEELQCGSDRDHRFIVHGLWPNYRSESPSFCRSRWQRPNRRTMRSVLDIMPSRGLIAHQWRKHGSCSGLDPERYFATLRDAYERVVIPPGLATLQSAIEVRPKILREAFVAANPDMSERGIFARCRGEDLVDVRICLTPGLAFRDCPRVRDRRCRSRLLEIDPPQ